MGRAERGKAMRRAALAIGFGHRARIAAVCAASLALLALCAGPAWAAAPEEPVTETATGVAATEATLHAALNPHASATAGFEFSYNTDGACAEGPVTELHEEHTGKGLVAEQLLTGLEPNREYTFCAVATHQEGETLETTSGQPLTFKTLIAPPAVESEGVSDLTPFEARLEATVNPENDRSTCRFEYGPTTAYVTTVPCEPEALEGFGGQGVAVVLEPLAPGSTVHFRVVVENEAGEKTEGKDSSFRTPGPPEAITGAASSPTRTIADVAGTVDPRGASTTSHFVYVEAAKYRPGASECPAGVACAYAEGMRSEESSSVGDEYEPVEVHEQLREMRPGTTYHYALVATNAAGTVVGPDMTVTTEPALPPLVSTGEAAVSGPSSATIAGSVATRELASTFFFEVGTTPEGALPVSGTVTGTNGETLSVSASFGGSLLAGTTYYYRLLASNSDGEAQGAWRTFTTPSVSDAPAPAPTVVISWPSFVTAQFAGLGLGPPSSSPPRKLTKKQLLARALKACNSKPKRRRAACHRQAKRRYR